MILTVPWAPPPAPVNGDIVVQASRLRLSRRRDVPAFLVAALTIRRAARQAGGFAGLGLRADLGRLTFFTLSGWADASSLEAFVATRAHRAAMTRFGPRMAESHFVTRNVAPADHLPPSWSDARRWLDHDETALQAD